MASTDVLFECANHVWWVRYYFLSAGVRVVFVCHDAWMLCANVIEWRWITAIWWCARSDLPASNLHNCCSSVSTHFCCSRTCKENAFAPCFPTDISSKYLPHAHSSNVTADINLFTKLILRLLNFFRFRIWFVHWAICGIILIFLILPPVFCYRAPRFRQRQAVEHCNQVVIFHQCCHCHYKLHWLSKKIHKLHCSWTRLSKNYLKVKIGTVALRASLASSYRITCITLWESCGGSGRSSSQARRFAWSKPKQISNVSIYEMFACGS